MEFMTTCIILNSNLFILQWLKYYDIIDLRSYVVSSIREVLAQGFVLKNIEPFCTQM